MKKTNMDLYDEALGKVHKDERRTIFPHKVIGALSRYCPQEVWEEVLDMVVDSSKPKRRKHENRN